MNFNIKLNLFLGAICFIIMIALLPLAHAQDRAPNPFAGDWVGFACPLFGGNPAFFNLTISPANIVTIQGFTFGDTTTKKAPTFTGWLSGVGNASYDEITDHWTLDFANRIQGQNVAVGANVAPGTEFGGEMVLFFGRDSAMYLPRLERDTTHDLAAYKRDHAKACD